MRVTVKIEDIKVVIESDEVEKQLPNSPNEFKSWGKNIVCEAITPTLEAATAKAKELHELKYNRFK